MELKGLMHVINEIIKYGLVPNLLIANKERDLEQNLFKIYFYYFEIEFDFNKSEYQEIEELPDLNI